MKKLPIKIKTVRLLSVILATLLSVFIVGKSIAMSMESSVNHYLNCVTQKIVEKGDTDVDTEYFKRTTTADTVGQLCADICEELESEGLVLLKNENSALPLKNGAKVSLFGTGAYKFNYSAMGSSSTSSVDNDNLKTALEKEGFSVNESLLNAVSKSSYGRTQISLVYTINEAPWSVYSAASSTFADYGDAAIVVLTRDSSEGQDVSTYGSDGLDGSYLSISQEERDILTNLTTLKKGGTFKSIIVLLNAAVPIQLDFLTADDIEVDSCMWVGNVGKTGINAIAKVLNGTVNPSGRLSDTYTYDNFSSPVMASWALSNAQKKFGQEYVNPIGTKLEVPQKFYGVYVEGIYVGYRYYETRYEDVVLNRTGVGEYDYDNVVAYPFGHGISYTSFVYTDYSVQLKDDKFNVSVTVTNDGSVAGKETVQIYLQKPYIDGGVEKSAIELAGYAKTDVLQPGKSQTLTITVNKEQFKSYDTSANGGAGGYVLDAGNYYLAVGKNAHDALNNVLKQKGYDKGGDSSFVYTWNNASRDETTYSLSTETLKPVNNKLDFIDLNRYENAGDNSVTYVSRSNWTATWPTAKVTVTLNEQMIADLQAHKPIDDTGFDYPDYETISEEGPISLIMLRGLDYDNDAWGKFLDQMSFADQSKLVTHAAFGTVEFGAPLNKPATKDNDGPTGVVSSLTKSSFPSEGIWAATFNDELIERAGIAYAEDALNTGYQCMYAPGINIHRAPFIGRAHEYFSEDPYLSGMACVAEVKGMQSRGVVPTLKHFIFNDEEDHRDGIGIWMNEQEAREIMLLPFEYAMRPSMGNAHGVMTSFNRAGCIWTSASKELMIDICRDEWGFDGFSITDMALSYGPLYMVYDDGIMAGTSSYLDSGNENTLSEYYVSPAFCQSLRESCHRILYVECNFSAAMNGISSTTVIVPVTPWWQILLNVCIIVLAVLTACACGLWVYDYIRKFTATK